MLSTYFSTGKTNNSPKTNGCFTVKKSLTNISTAPTTTVNKKINNKEEEFIPGRGE